MIGSTKWLIDTENHFGGYHNDVPRNKISEHDPRKKMATLGMSGGDRMQHHGYAQYYSRYLTPFVSRRHEPLVIVEVGILKGTGIAIWSTLFPNAEIFGLDIDLLNFQNNRDFLETQGAFKTSTLKLHEFDQFKNNKEYIKNILNGKKIDIIIDDGFHSDDTILNTLSDTVTHLNDSFVYFIEDNKTVYHKVKDTITDANVYKHKQLTVITKNV